MKNVNMEELTKIEIKKDGRNAERFGSLLRHIVSVPKEALDKREAAYKKERQKKKKG